MKTKDDIMEQYIINSSKQVFMQYGYKKVTMGDISEASGKGRSTLYHYFKNKHEVFEQVAIQLFCSAIAASLKQVDAKKTLSDNLNQFHKNKLKQLSLIAKQYTHLVKDVREEKEIMLEVDKITWEIERKYTAEMINWAIKNKEIVPQNDNTIKSISFTIVTALNCIQKEMIFWSKIDLLNKQIESLINLIIEGLK